MADGYSYDTTTVTKYTYDSYGRISKIVEKWESRDSDGNIVKYGENGKRTEQYTYSGYYKKQKYPKKTLVYYNGHSKADLKIISTYESKKI